MWSPVERLKQQNNVMLINCNVLVYHSCVAEFKYYAKALDRVNDDDDDEGNDDDEGVG